MKKLYTATFAAALFVAGFSTAQPQSNNFPSEVGIKNSADAKRIKQILQRPDTDIDLARVKLTIDKMIDPTINIEANLKRLGNPPIFSGIQK